MIRRSLLAALTLLVLMIRGAPAADAPFVVVSTDPSFKVPDIVIHHDPKTGAGCDWAKASKAPWYDSTELGKTRDAAVFLQEGIRKITGRSLAIRSGPDVAGNIVLVTSASAPAALRADPAVTLALRNDGSDAYNDREAFFLRSTPERLLLVANTADGLAAGVVELLESVGYEVLGMGPNWVHVPVEHRERLVFQIERAGRPSYYIRGLMPTSGQSYGVGTIMAGPMTVLHEPDETVTASWIRWSVGARLRCQSMPGFPGHALQAYHKAVVDKMRQTGATAGFLVPQAHLGADAARPEASAENKGNLWINTDARGQPAADKVWLSNGKVWTERNLAELGVNLDLSVPVVRELILADMKKRAEAHFARQPGALFVFGTDPEDGGGYADLARLLKHKDWYPDYRKAEGLALDRPYVLHGHNGIDQPREGWDPSAASDIIFAFNNWLLREFDKWLESRPAAERVTASGEAKKNLVRCSLYSYNYHDVPPSFNLDARIRVMIASYPKHRGLGKWKAFVSHADLARAFKVLLPREPSADYRIISLAYFADFSSSGIPASWSAAPSRIANDLRTSYQSGFKAISYETDFNFGKYGLAYYLISKMLWQVERSAADLDALRTRWLQRAFGSGWREMKAYYDFLLVENLPVNAPNSWARAVRLIDAADAKIDPSREADARRRLDDVKQYWYYHYLLQSGKATKSSPEMLAFAWKGQMSYMVAEHVVMRRIFGARFVTDAIPEDIRRGPAHYTAEETQAWWKQVRDYWPLVPVNTFTEATLADGTKGKDVDLNDLVRIESFQVIAPGSPFYLNGGSTKPPGFLTVARAGEEMGFQLSWRAGDGKDRYYAPRDVVYGVERWDPKARIWQPVVDPTTTAQPSEEAAGPQGKRHVARVRLQAPHDGTYRFDVGFGGNAAQLTHLGFDVGTGKINKHAGFTFFSKGSAGLTQDPVWIYIPKKTASLDLEVWDKFGGKKLTLYKGQSPKGLIVSRQLDISKLGTHQIKLEKDEDGNLARIAGNGFAFPYLYSIPPYWAKSPAELLVPRAIADADHLAQIEKGK